MENTESDSVVPPKENIDLQLKRLDLRLKRLDRWLKLIGIPVAVIGAVATCISILTSVSQKGLLETQRDLVAYQANDAKEKQRVHFTMELSPYTARNGKEILLNASFTNNSVRQVSVLMVGIRLWKDWKKGYNVKDNPDFLLYSDTMVANCPSGICPRSTPKSTLQDTGPPIVIAAGETHKETFGPYPIERGAYIEGWAYSAEQDEGNCGIVGPPLVPAAFPTICEEHRKNQQKCWEKANCKRAYAPTQYHAPR